MVGKDAHSAPGAPAESGPAPSSKKSSGGITLPSILSSLILRIFDGDDENVPVSKGKQKKANADRKEPQSGLPETSPVFKDRFKR